MSMACGLATTGKVPYASTFAIFATGRAYDQVRLGIAHNELKVRVCASHGGLSLGEDGASHQMIEDIALMRAMPKMQVVVPADYNQAYRAVLESYEREGPMYMRFGRPATPFVYDEVPETLGGGVDVLREGRTSRSSPAATWCGGRSRRPRSSHREEGVDAEVRERRDHQAARLRGRAGLARPHGRRRDRRGAPQGRRPRGRDPRGGGRAVPGADLRRRRGATRFGLSGTGEAVMERFGLTAAGIADTVRQALVLKPVVRHSPVIDGDD